MPRDQRHLWTIVRAAVNRPGPLPIPGPEMRSRPAVLPLAALALLAGPGSALAAEPTAVEPRVAYTDSRIELPVSAALPDGRVALAWTNSATNGDSTLGLVRPAGGVLPTAPQVLGTGVAAEDLRLLGDGPANNPLLTSFQAGDSQTVVTMRLGKDSFATPTPVLGLEARGRYPTSARCPDGSTVFGYQRTNSSPTSYTVHSWRADALGRQTVIGATGVDSPDADQAPVVTCDRTDTPLLAYGADPDGAASLEGEELIVRALDGGAPILQRETAPGGYASTPDARLAPDGRMWSAWTEGVGGSSTVYVATRAPGSNAAPTVTALDTDMEISRLFFDPAGNTHLVLVDPHTLEWTVRTAAPGSSTFAGSVQLPEATGSSGRVLTGHPDGRPRLMLTRGGPNGTTDYHLLGIAPAGSGNSLSPRILRVNGDASFSWLPTGDLFAAGVQESGPNSAQLIEGGLDGGEPTLADLDVPPVAVPAVPTRMRVKASDPLGLRDFSFEVDGEKYTEQDIAHTFTHPGTYDITVTAVDRAGNVAVLTRSIRVLDPVQVIVQPEPEIVIAPREVKAPTLLRAAASRGSKGKAKQKVTIKFGVDETVAADVELIGSFKKGKSKATLVLKATRVEGIRAGTARPIALGIPKGLDKVVVKGKLLVRITLTDLAGNRTQKSIAVKTVK